MRRERIDMHRLQELVRLHRQGVGCRDVAKCLELSPNTERKYRTALDSQGLLKGDPCELPELDELQEAVRQALGTPESPLQELSSIETFRPAIAAMLPKAGPKAIFDRLRLEHMLYIL